LGLDVFRPSRNHAVRVVLAGKPVNCRGSHFCAAFAERPQIFGSIGQYDRRLLAISATIAARSTQIRRKATKIYVKTLKQSRCDDLWPHESE
jgi:hypothetical protein